MPGDLAGDPKMRRALFIWPGRSYLLPMKRVLTLVVALAIVPPAATAEEEGDEGLSLMERGAQMFMEGIRREMEPALDDLQGFARELQPALRSFLQEMGPAFAEILGEIKDLSAYHPPEILPNGDIILRKKQPDEIADETPDGEIEI